MDSSRWIQEILRIILIRPAKVLDEKSWKRAISMMDFWLKKANE